MAAVVAKAATGAAAAKDAANAASTVRGGGRQRTRQPSADRALVASIAVLFGTGFLRYALVEKELPPRKWWVGTTVVAAMLSLTTDLAPGKGARAFSYMVLLSAVLANSIPIFKSLTDADAASDTAAAGPETTPAAFAGTNSVLQPVFLRPAQPGRAPAGGGPGAQVETFVAAHRAPRKRAKRPQRSTTSPYGTTRL